MSILRGHSHHAPEARSGWAGDIPPNSEVLAPPSSASVPARFTTESAMRHGAVFQSINFIADLISTLPIDTYERDPRDTQAISEEVPLPPVIAEPAPDVDPVSWRRQVIVSWLAQGNVFPYPVAYDDQYRPRLTQIIDPQDMWARRPNGKYGAIMWVLGGRDVPNIIHRPAYCLPGSPIGLSPIGYAAATAVHLGLTATEFGRRWFLDGAHPSGILTSENDISDKTAKRIKRRVLAVMRGTRDPLVLGSGLKYEKISVPANESQFLETIGANKADVAGYFGLKPEDIGAKSGDSMTYANVEQRALDRLIYPIYPWVVRYESLLTHLAPPNVFAKVKTDALVRVDLRTRYDVHGKAIQIGMENVDDRRRLEDKPPLPDGLGQRYVWPPMSTAPDPGASIRELIVDAGIDPEQITLDQLQQLIGAAA